MANMAIYNEAQQWLNDYRAMLGTSHHDYAASQIRRGAREQRANLEVAKRRRLSGLFDLAQYEQAVEMLERAVGKL